MKKSFFILATALLVLVSCQNEDILTQNAEKMIVFSANILESADTRVSVDCSNGKVTWVAGDEITISDGENTGVYTADNTGTITTFSYKSGTQFSAAGTYSATYGTMPAVGVDQVYSTTPGELIHMTAPDVVVSSASDAFFHFQADCGILKLNLTAASKSVKRIYVSDGTNIFSLVCETAQDISTAKDFYIALPAGNYKKYVIEDNAGYGAVKTAKEGNETVIATNTIKKVNFGSLSFNAPIYPESLTPGINIDGLWWAPVNCGYSTSNTNGLLYQWGRKDGQTSSSDKILSYSPMNLEELDANKFVYTSNASNNWYTGSDPAPDDLWKEDGSTKYNPCPSGWRVPTNGELTSLISNKSKVTNGYYFYGSKTVSAENPSVLFTYTGYRDYNGTYGSSGSRGDYWSSTPVIVTTTAYFLQIDSNVKMYNKVRTIGRAVRCVKK